MPYDPKNEVQFRYTTARRVYDYAGTLDLGDINFYDHRDRRFRMVAIPERLLDQQEGRYGSGLHVSLHDQTLADRVAWGDVVYRAPEVDETGDYT